MEHGGRFYFDWPIALWIVFLLVGGTVLGFVLSRGTRGRIANGVYICGVPVGKLHPEEARELLERELASMADSPITLTAGEETWLVVPSAAGLTPDYDETIEQAMIIRRQGDAARKEGEIRTADQDGISVPLAIEVDSVKWAAYCAGLAGKVGRAPRNASLTFSADGGAVAEPGAAGRELDGEAFLAALTTCMQRSVGRECELPVGAVQPAFERILGYYVTKFNTGDKPRTHNLKTAAAALDELVVEPGGEFSFNDRVGPRVIEKGYLEAPVLLSSRLVLGVGGGVCQVSTTLFNAVLLANLPVLQRVNHSVPSSYVPLGQDATVAYGVADFVFKNNTENPVLLMAEVAGDSLAVAIAGGSEETPEIGLSVEIKKVIPFETIVENDLGLAVGTESVTQRGNNGYLLQLWRNKTWPDGRSDREPIGDVCYYPPAARIVKRGVGSPRYGDSAPLRQDAETPENAPMIQGGTL